MHQELFSETNHPYIPTYIHSHSRSLSLPATPHQVREQCPSHRHQRSCSLTGAARAATLVPPPTRSTAAHRRVAITDPVRGAHRGGAVVGGGGGDTHSSSGGGMVLCGGHRGLDPEEVEIGATSRRYTAPTCPLLTLEECSLSTCLSDRGTEYHAYWTISPWRNLPHLLDYLTMEECATSI